MTKDKLSSAAVLLGRKGGKARAKKYSTEELAEMRRQGGSPRWLSEEQVAALLGWRAEKVPVPEIARRLGVKPITVWKRLRKLRESSAPEKEGR